MTVANCGGAHTYGDYLQWSRPYGDELIDGNHYVREPSPTRTHQNVAYRLYLEIAYALERTSFGVYGAPLDVRLPKAAEDDDEIDTVVQPDVFIVCDPKKVDERGCRGGPDWVAEVLSPSTERHDKVVKVPVYERAGVRELWLVDPYKLVVNIYLLQNGRYGSPISVAMIGRTQLVAVPGITVNWDRLLSRGI
jgi:Uma2 family endonuclease